MTMGGTPYPSVPMEQLFDKLRQGYRMEQPHDCPDEVYELMSECWQHRSEDRPTFSKIVDVLEDILMGSMCEEVSGGHSGHPSSSPVESGSSDSVASSSSSVASAGRDKESGPDGYSRLMDRRLAFGRQPGASTSSASSQDSGRHSYEKRHSDPDSFARQARQREAATIDYVDIVSGKLEFAGVERREIKRDSMEAESPTGDGSSGRGSTPMSSSGCSDPGEKYIELNYAQLDVHSVVGSRESVV